ncbi:MSCRAMM family adhesin SdrC [Mammaliicoccus sciuri]|uniref:MSCRAMM family adhesin SdrC n=1 Tax=Mammaliicoccus sciuri TaxID=1296 RepID=UPI0020BF9262|nr:MSCRAMM family adhesin SdrC [Mammaliicoccus sciuri]
MLTKEFATKVGLSEKQVRKIVQHLEDRGYQLSKTEYRGREATDFQEEDIELFQEIAEKVKETNSYDQAFETLEQEKDFLQVLVKDEPANQTPELQHLIEELKLEVQHMRRERQMLGEMLQQVHIQQQKLEQTLALQAPQQSEATAQENNTKVETKQAEQPQSSKVVSKDKTSSESVETKKQEDKEVTKVTAAEEPAKSETQAEVKSENKETAVKPETTTDKVVVSKEEDTTTAKEETTDKAASTEEKVPETTVEQTSTLSENKEEEVVKEEIKSETEEEPKKKGFFQRLFNI